ncbi:MAG: hypothetical protein HQL16_04640 [Candidatus Omnitrophica bacterium]|nr:hypothetical protein [Candidatus Omnitrophota bacterium]
MLQRNNKKRAQIIIEHILLMIAVIIVLIAVTSDKNGHFANAINKIFQLPSGLLHDNQIKINP